MTHFHPMRCCPFLSLSILFLRFGTLIADPVSLFSIKGFQTADLGSSNFALLGDAKSANGGSRVNLTSRSSPSSGTLVFKKPLKLIDAGSGKPISFSTEFVFSISPGGHGDGLALVILPDGDLSQIFGQGVKRERTINLEGRHSASVEISINSLKVFSCVYLVDTKEQHLVNQNLTFKPLQ